MENRHHSFWMRRNYKTPLERAFRNHHGLVIPTDVDLHKELHAHMSPPPKPNRDLMIGIINNLEDHHLTHPLDGLLFTIDYVEDRNERLTNHLVTQLGYLGVEGVGYEVQRIMF